MIERRGLAYSRLISGIDRSPIESDAIKPEPSSTSFVSPRKPPYPQEILQLSGHNAFA